VEGNYGYGKSHVLKSIEVVALREGFAVSWVTLDGQNHACNHPTRYFHSLLENIQVPSVPIRGLASLVRRWLRGQEANSILAWAKQSESWLRESILECQRRINVTEDAPYLDARLECRDIANNSGKVWFETVSQRMHATADLVRAAGFNGVVYLLDELETVATLLFGVRQRYLAYEFLNFLVDGRKHPHCLFAFAATPDFGIKLETDRIDKDYYASEYPNGCRFIQKWHESSVDLMRLRKISRSDVANLCKLLRAYHEEAFGWKSDGRLSDEIVERLVDRSVRLNMGTRDVIRSFIHVLEICEQYPNVNV
jgi:hypothetical protein